MATPDINSTIYHFAKEMLHFMGIEVKEISLDKALVLHKPDEALVELKDISDISPGTRLHLDMTIVHQGSKKTLTSKIYVEESGDLAVENFSIETTEINPEDVEDNQLTEKAKKTLKKYEFELKTLVVGALKIVFEVIKGGKI